MGKEIRGQDDDDDDVVCASPVGQWKVNISPRFAEWNLRQPGSGSEGFSKWQVQK